MRAEGIAQIARENPGEVVPELNRQGAVEAQLRPGGCDLVGCRIDAGDDASRIAGDEVDDREGEDDEGEERGDEFAALPHHEGCPRTAAHGQLTLSVV